MHDDRPWVILAATAVLLAGTGVAASRYWGEAAAMRDLEVAVGSLAFGTVVAAPGVLALLSLQDRPVLALPAALLLIPLSFISFALVTLPLLIPATMLVVRYVRAGTGGVRDLATTFGVALLLLAALLTLFAREDPRSWSTPVASGSTSDIISWAESGLSLLLVAAAIVGGWWASRPVQPVIEKPQMTSV